MPTYSYTCRDCGNAFDIQQAFTDDALTVCPICGGTLRKVFGAVGVTFNGSVLPHRLARRAKTAAGRRRRGRSSVRAARRRPRLGISSSSSSGSSSSSLRRPPARPARPARRTSSSQLA